MGDCLIMRRGGETWKPAILNAAYPQDVNLTVIKGNTTSAAFNVLISEAGTPAEYTYKWYLDGAAVEGATGSSYVMEGLSETATHTVYCEVTNKGGVVQSRVAALSVTQHYTPTLDGSYPADVTEAEVGGSAVFEVGVSADGVPNAYSYQWYVNGSAVSGATSSSYTRSSLAYGTYSVYCTVTNEAGTTVSRTATLTVTTNYLYKAGDTNTGFKAKSWRFSTSAYGMTPSISYGTSAATFKSTQDQGRAGIVYFPNPYDLTQYNTLTAKATLDGKINSNARPEGLYVWSALTGSTYVEAATARSLFNGTGTKTLSINVSNLNGTYYIGFGLRAESSSSPETVTVTEVTLK